MKKVLVGYGFPETSIELHQARVIVSTTFEVLGSITKSSKNRLEQSTDNEEEKLAQD